jgi:hypothetical protein
MKQLILVPALGATSLAIAAVGYAVAGILLAVLLVGIVAAPFVFLYRKFAPKRFQHMQAEIRPIW